MTRYRPSAVATALVCAILLAVLGASARGALGVPRAPATGFTAEWTAKSLAPVRWWSAATFMPLTCELLAYGGQTVDSAGNWGVSRDTLLYSPDTDTWEPPLVQRGGPPALQHQGLSWDPDNGVAVMFGGSWGSATNVTFGFEPHLRTWTKLVNEKRCTSTTCPSPRSMHAQAWSSALGATLVFGGRGASDREVTNDLWELRPVTGKRGTVTWRWTQLSPDPQHPNLPAPAARSRHGMAEITYGPYVGQMLIYGGWNAKMEALSDTWLYNPKTKSFQLLESAGAPTPRQAFGMAFSPTLRMVVIQGGQTNSMAGAQIFTPETWAFDGYSWVLVATNKPLPGNAEPPPQRRTGHDLVSNTCGAGSVILYDAIPPNGPPPTQQPTWVLK